MDNNVVQLHIHIAQVEQSINDRLKPALVKAIREAIETTLSDFLPELERELFTMEGGK